MNELIRARLLFVLWLSFLLSQCALGVGLVLLLPDTARGWDMMLLDDPSFLLLSIAAITALAAGVSMTRWKFRWAETRATTQWICIDACGVLGGLLAIWKQDSLLAVPFIILSFAALLKVRPTVTLFLQRGSE